MVLNVICVVPENIHGYSPHRRDWKFLGGGGFSKAQKFKSMYEAFKTGISREVGESKEKSLPWGRYG